MFRRKSRRSLVHPDEVKDVGWEANKSKPSRPWKHKVIYNGGEDGYAVAVGALIDEDGNVGREVCAIRWNGSYKPKRANAEFADSGTPAPGGRADWFVLPEFLWIPTLEACERMTKNGIGVPDSNAQNRT